MDVVEGFAGVGAVDDAAGQRAVGRGAGGIGLHGAGGKVGDRVTPGDIIADMETDKATAEVDAPEAFTLCGIRKTARGMVLIIEE